VFIIIPLSLSLVALIAATVIVWRKMPYLRKLTPESHEVGQTLLHDFAPELMEWIAGIPWRRFVHNVLVEFEKILRWGRVLMSSVDRASDRFIRRVRRVHEETARQQEEIRVQREEELIARQTEEPDELDMDDPEQLRAEEQRLIVAIAQNPKDALLFSRLARVYMRLESYADAVDSLKAAAKLAPDDESIAKRLERAQRRLEKQAAEAKDAAPTV